MRAVVADGSPGLVRLVEVAPPVPAGSDVLVDVAAISVNRGELHRLREAVPGWRPGWDFAGTVAESCGGTGFRPGQRVFGIAGAGGAWAERVAVPTGRLAPLPAGLGDESAAALPVAGVTALRVLRLAAGLAGRRVLVTGAAGGVGRFATQLAHTAGAEVTAVARDEHRAGLRELGADTVVAGLSSMDDRYDVILESVGGLSLEQALDAVADDGLIVTFGNSARTPATLPVARFYPRQAILRGYYLLDDIKTNPPARDLAELADRTVGGRLRVDVDAVHEIGALPEVLRALAERRVVGKAVLTMR